MTQNEQNRLYYQSLNYLEGIGVEKDEFRSFALNVQAAKHGHADAVLAMGWFYLNGTGVAQDIEKAKEWYRKSARRRDPRAMFSLGQIAYMAGDWSDALLWFNRAADAGHARSFYWLGKLYWKGRGIQQSKNKAMHYFHKATSLKVYEARRFLRFHTQKNCTNRRDY